MQTKRQSLDMVSLSEHVSVEYGNRSPLLKNGIVNGE